MNTSENKSASLNNPLLLLFALFFFLLIPITGLALEKKAIIIGNSSGHENTIKNNFAEWAPDDWQVDRAMDIGGISDPTNVSEVVNYAIDNSYSIVIRSYTNAYNYKSEYDLAASSSILVFQTYADACSPIGCGTYRELSTPPHLFSAVTVSGGSTSTEQTYGPGLEFFDQTSGGSVTLSYTNGVVAGKAAQIINQFPSHNIWDVRQHLRQIGSYYDSGWTKENGYGRPATSSISSVTLELAPPLEIEYSLDRDAREITFTWKRFEMTDEDGVRIYVEKNGTTTEIYEGQGESFTWDYDVEITEYTPAVFYIRSYSDEPGVGESKDESYSTINEVLFGSSFSGSGSGTEADPYEITDVFRLQEMITDLSAYYEMTGDIDAASTTGWNSGDGFDPIGDSSTSFTGTFDGQGYKISNLYINRGSENYSGLFGHIGIGGTVKNLGVENIDIYTNQSIAGGLAAYNEGTIENSYSTGEIDGANYLGGLVGSNDGSISGSFASTTVTQLSGIFRVGGLVGDNDGSIADSYATGNVSATGEQVGGLVGSNESGGTISRSYSTGNVTTTANADAIGGLGGRTLGSISGSFSVGGVSGSGDVAGFVGNSSFSSGANSYWHNHSGNPDTGLAGGATSSSVIAISEGNHPPYFYSITNPPFDQWEFATVWSSANNGTDYPVHQWMTSGTNQAPTASFSTSTSNLTISFDASDSSDSDGSIASYLWEFGDSATSTGETTQHTYSSAGSYTVVLTVTDNDGASASTTNSVSPSEVPNQAPTASFSTSKNNLTISFDASASTDADGSIASYLWEFGDNATSSGQTANHTYGSSGSYSTVLTVTDNDGATASTSKQVSPSAASSGGSSGGGGGGGGSDDDDDEEDEDESTTATPATEFELSGSETATVQSALNQVTTIVSQLTPETLNSPSGRSLLVKITTILQGLLVVLYSS